MINTVKELQTELAKDLVQFEELNLSEDRLKMIEEVYQRVYNILDQANKE